MGVLYILDEPSIGLHQRDNAKLIATLTRLRDLGNTVLVVEHDEETIRTADWVVDIGPGAGEHGGEIIANGPLEAVLAEPRSITGAFLRGERAVPIPTKRRKGNGKALRRPRRARAQPAGRRPARPARHVRGRDRRVGQRQEHARHRGPVPGARPRAQRLARAGRRARHARGRRAHRQDHRDRPEPDRPDAALQPGDLRRAVHADPRAVRRRPGVARPRLHAGPVQLQRQGRPLRELQGRRDPQDRDAVPARRLRPVRGLQGQALQPRGARDPLQGQVDRRRPRDDDRRGARLLRGRAERPGQAPDAERRRARATSTSASRRRRCRAARRSGSSSRPSCRGGRPAGRCTSSTSRRPASTSPTSRSCSRSSTGWSTAATRSSSSSTTSTSSRPPTGSSTSGPEGGDRGGRIIAEGTPEKVAATAEARRPASTWPGSCAASRSCRCRTSRSPRRPAAASDGNGHGADGRGAGSTPSRKRPRRRQAAAADRAPLSASGLAYGACPTSTSPSWPTPPRPCPARSSTSSAAGSPGSAGAASRCATRTSPWSSVSRSRRPRPTASTRSGSSCSIPTAARWPARPGSLVARSQRDGRDAVLTFSIDLWNLTFPAPGDYSFRILVNGSERKRLPLLLLAPPDAADGASDGGTTPGG